MPIDPELRSQLPPRVTALDVSTWENWHGNVRTAVDGFFRVENKGEAKGSHYRATVADFQKFLALAAARQKSVRALGGGWSFSNIATNPDWMFETANLQYAFRLRARHLSGRFRERAGDLFFVQGGTKISELNRLLETKYRRSLWTCGASNGQSIAGAISTGTHGSALAKGAIHSHVAAIHLVTGPNRSVLVERDSDRATTSKFANLIGANPERNDRLFDAALVGLGALGFVAGVLLDTDPLFLLESSRGWHAYNDTLKHTLDTLDFNAIDLPVLGRGADPYFFMAVINPFDLDRASVHAMLRDDNPPPTYVPNYDLHDGDGPGYELLELLATLADVAGPAIPPLVKLLFSNRLKPKERQIGTLGETFDYSNQRHGAAGSSVGVPLQQTSTVIDLLIDEMNRGEPAPVIFATRFVRNSGATLEFTKHPSTCVIEIDGLHSDRTLVFLDRAIARLQREGVDFTQHWGKINHYDKTNLETRFGTDALSAYRFARNTLQPNPQLRKLFNNPFIEQIGLDL